jgi:hypothetical protein
MNIYLRNTELVFSCFNQRREIVAEEMLKGLNLPTRPPWELATLPAFCFVEQPYLQKEVQLDFALVDNGIPVRGAALRRILLWAPRSNPESTVFMTNNADGMELGIHKLSRRVSWRCVSAVILDRQPQDDPGYAFYYYDQHQQVKRVIAAIRDTDGWVFNNEGECLAFENPKFYHQQRIPDRLNRRIITEYMLSIGYDIARDSFWETDEMATFIWQR